MYCTYLTKPRGVQKQQYPNNGHDRVQKQQIEAVPAIYDLNQPDKAERCTDEEQQYTDDGHAGVQER